MKFRYDFWNPLLSAPLLCTRQLLSVFICHILFCQVLVYTLTIISVLNKCYWSVSLNIEFRNFQLRTSDEMSCNQRLENHIYLLLLGRYVCYVSYYTKSRQKSIFIVLWHTIGSLPILFRIEIMLYRDTANFESMLWYFQAKNKYRGIYFDYCSVSQRRALHW